MKRGGRTQTTFWSDRGAVEKEATSSSLAHVALEVFDTNTSDDLKRSRGANSYDNSTVRVFSQSSSLFAFAFLNVRSVRSSYCRYVDRFRFKHTDSDSSFLSSPVTLVWLSCPLFQVAPELCLSSQTSRRNSNHQLASRAALIHRSPTRTPSRSPNPSPAQSPRHSSPMRSSSPDR